MSGKVVVIGTGGTIASRYDPARGSKVAAATADDLLAMLPAVGDIAAIEVDNFATINSYHLTVDQAFAIARRVRETLARDDVAGVVVTQGTDVLEETSYLASLIVDPAKPAVFTGAQRSADEPDADGPRNLLDSIRAAAAPATAGLGAMVCFNGELHAAREVTKVHSAAVQTFQSYGYGHLGVIDGGLVSIGRRPVARPTFAVDRPEHRVDLVKLALGADARFIDWVVGDGGKGLVVEAFGLGNATVAVAEGIARATEAGVVVGLVSRCPSGSVRPVYGGGGGGRDLAEAGAHFMGDLSGPKARLLLMVILADAPPADTVNQRLLAAFL